MNIRLTLTAALAVILASLSVNPLIQGWGWFFGGVGAVLVVAAAGAATRLAPAQATVAACVLTLIACLPLLAIPHWYSRAGAVAIVAAGALGLTRRRRLAAVPWLLTYLSALLIYLNAAFAAGWSIAGFLPSRASIHHLAVLTSSGFSERTSVPPVPGSHGIVLVAAAGIGLMAVATDLLAVRLRSPAIAGLPLLALFSVPITTNAKQGGFGATLVFCLGIIGYLTMLAADGRDRLRIWGRLVTVWQYRDTEAVQGPDTRALAASGRRIGLAAISIAILLPLLIPGIGAHGLFASHNHLGPGGKTRVVLPNPIAQMQHQLQDNRPRAVLTYTTTSPSAADQYLQVYVLNYDSNRGQWTLVTPSTSTLVSSKALRAAPGTSRQTQEVSVRTKVSFGHNVSGYGSNLSFLAVPYAPASLAVSGDWAEDNATLMVYSTKTALGDLSYSATSKIATPSLQQLQASAGASTSLTAADYLGLPATHQQQLTQIADIITKGQDSAFGKALALQRYFTSGKFTYNLNVHLPDSTAGLIDFLTKTHKGYCQQFAFAMAILARVLSIPSRIAVGYTAGTQQSNGAWQVTTADAHAWPELFFPGAGWLRFEPTPPGPGGQDTAIEPSYAPTAPGGAGPTTPASPGQGGPGGPAPTGPKGGFLPKLNHLTPPDRPAGAPTAGGTGFPYGWVILAVLVLVLMTPAGVRIMIRRHRWRRAADPAGLASAAWRELRDDLADHGMTCRASETPRAVARRVTAALGLESAPAQALERIATAEEQARYAALPQLSPSLRQDADTVRRAISREADAPVRWRARLLPPSALAPARAGLQNALDVFGWMEAASLRIRQSRPLSRPHLAGDPGNARQILS